MPITTQVALTYEVQSVAIDGTGAVSGTIGVSAGTRRIQTIAFDLGAAECAPVWGGNGDASKTRWEDLKGKLYELLVAKGVIA